MGLGHLPGSTVPAVAGKMPQVELSKQGSKFVFDVKGVDHVQYIYSPASGTLSDLSVSFNGGKAFACADNVIDYDNFFALDHICVCSVKVKSLCALCCNGLYADS